MSRVSNHIVSFNLDKLLKFAFNSGYNIETALLNDTDFPRLATDQGQALIFILHLPSAFCTIYHNSPKSLQSACQILFSAAPLLIYPNTQFVYSGDIHLCWFWPSLSLLIYPIYSPASWLTTLMSLSLFTSI